MTPIEVMEAIIAENLERDLSFYDPPEWAEMNAAEALQQIARRKYDSHASSTRFRPFGAYGSNSLPVPLDWWAEGSNTVAYR